MKVEVFDIVDARSDSALSATSARREQMQDQEALALKMQKGLDRLNYTPRHRFDNFWQGHRHGNSHRHAFKSFKFIVAQLHKNGLLDAPSMVALVLNSLPEVIFLLVEDSAKLNWKLGHKLPKMQAFLEDLQTLVANTEGMEHCATFVTDWREQKICPTEACTQVLTSLQLLPFSSQVMFLQALYAMFEDKLLAKLMKAEEKFPWMPVIPMVHEGITCDRCNLSPIQGLRFKCKVRPNYDLCADCYNQKDDAEECSVHDFKTISFPLFGGLDPLTSMFKGHCKGKGKGKSDLFDKGKCKCFGKGGLWKGMACHAIWRQAKLCNVRYGRR
jgi:hypothetical protein